MSMVAPATFSAPIYQSIDDEPTRHLARVANAASPAASLQRVGPLIRVPYPTSTSSWRDCSLRRPPQTPRKPLHRLRLRTPTTRSRTGSVKCWRRATTTLSTPVQRRRLLAYLLLAFVRSRKRPPKM
jgi:hypothetical protein